MGLIGLTIPEEYGGQGEDIYAAAAVIEELCQGGPSMAGPFIHAAFYGGLNISENGSKEQKEALLPRLAGGLRLMRAVLAHHALALGERALAWAVLSDHGLAHGRLTATLALVDQALRGQHRDHLRLVLALACKVKLTFNAFHDQYRKHIKSFKNVAFFKSNLYRKSSFATLHLDRFFILIFDA